MEMNVNMTKQKALLAFLALFFVIGNLFCLESSFHDEERRTNNNFSEISSNSTKLYCIDLSNEHDLLCADFCNTKVSNTDNRVPFTYTKDTVIIADNSLKDKVLSNIKKTSATAPPSMNGFLSAADISFEITTNTFPGDENGQHELKSITINGQANPYVDFITPDFFSTSLSVPSGIGLIHNQFGSTTSYLGRDYHSRPSTFETDILPVFQDRNLNSFMEVDNGAANKNYVLRYSTPIKVTSGLYVLVIERGGNNDQSIVAKNSNGDLNTVHISKDTYLDLGFKAGGNDYQNLQTVVFPLTDLAPLGTLITTLQVNFSGINQDGADGKVFIFGKDESKTSPPSVEICNNGIDDDGDGLVDCDDSDCSLMTNSGLEEGNNNFTYPINLEGSPARKIPRGSTELPEWSAGINGDCMYYVQDTEDKVNNPEGEYFIWLPGQWDCLIANRNFAAMGMIDGNEYTISFNVASWDISLDASCEPDGGAVTQDAGRVSLDIFDSNSSNLFNIPQSTSWTNLNWKKISHTFTYNAATQRLFGVTNTTTKGIAVDNIIVTAVATCNTTCQSPSITSVTPTNPNNCPTLNNGQIRITATGSNLRYSINNGVSYQSSNTFNNLSAGSYNIRVENSVGSCAVSHTSPVVLTDSNCSEICNNGIDDDSDGLIDCNDPDCGQPTISGVNRTNPNNCPALNNGQIVINATGNDLRFSINNGLSYQSSNTFSNLGNGNYTIRVRNNATGCSIQHNTTTTLSDPACPEICGNGIDDDGDGLIDQNDSDCSTTCITSFPYSEGFESGLGNWQQNTNDDFNWTRHTGTTPSGQTGPASAYQGSYYIYTEATNNFNNTAFLTGPCFDLTGICEADFSFRYNMNGVAMGTLEVEASTNNGSSWSSIWSESGNKGTSWLNATLSLDTYAGGTIQLRFKGTTGSNYTSDISVDDINLTTVICSVAEICDNNIDDDGDGLVDCNDGDCGKPVITSVTPTNPNNCPDLNNGTITIVATGNNLEYSIDNGGTYQSSNQFNNLRKGTYNIRVQNTATGCLATSTTTLSDSSCNENCTDGIDNNGDGQIDCDDDACGRPEIIGVTPENPDNCPVLDNGQITIIASGSNLRYSIDNGANFQSARIFTNLTNGAYIIIVQNNTTGCEISHLSTINLTDPTCSEICDNGIDDDGDGLTDCEDADCGRPTISDVNFTDPDNCPDLNNGTITITSSGANLEFSIDNGVTYQSNNIFNDLYADSYNITVRNTITGCEEDYLQNPVELTEPQCEEKCDNGIDDDGNGLIDYQDDACKNDWPVTRIPVETWLCEGNNYIFEVQSSLPNFQYEWNFGPYSSVATATGIGPHTIQFDPPTGTEAIFPKVYFKAITSTYEIRDTYSFQIRPAIVITNIAKNDPSDCGESDGEINLSIQRQSDACIEVSFDDGNTWVQENRVRFDQLNPGNYNIVARYCDEPCGSQSNIITLTNPNTSTILGNDDFADICPGQIYRNTVISNDIVQNRSVQYSIASPTSQGEINMTADGSFEYIVADSTFCGIDQFSYQVCHQDNTCCTTAFATLYLTDTTSPTLENVPDDITIGCDEEIPLPPFITAYDNCPSISIDKDEVSTQGLDGCALHNYTITRTWTATDICGNSTTDEQVVSIEDAIAPDIFRIYTLPNGKKMVAGVMENVSENWKTVSFPIQFSQSPLVFTQVVSNKDTSAVITRLRNISANQFELKLQEEEANTDPHFRETVSWIAMEAGTQTDGYLLDAKAIDVTNNTKTINFANTFNSTPACFTSVQTINEADAVVPRLRSIGKSSVQVNLEEERSNDTEEAHTSEKMAYLAVEQIGNIRNDIGDIIGEVGTVDINHKWTRVMTNNTYYNPIIITQVATKNDSDPVLSRVNMGRSGSFDLRLQEWDYLDDAHNIETVSYMVIEGSIPLNTSKYCIYGTDSLEVGVDMVAVDNCDPSVKIQYAESTAVAGANNHTIRTWFAEDACGNNTVYSQVINCQGIALRMKAYVQGALVNNGTTGLMRDDLRTKGLIPTEEPYSEMEGFTHIGTGGGETVSPELLAQTGNDAIVDWVFLEIKDGNNYDKVLVTCSALLQRDGDIVTAEGEPIISFYNLAHGDYYIKLRHRNHLGAETAYPYTFTTNNIPFIDFSNGFTPVRGNTPRVEIDEKLASWSGDLNGDDLTVFQGPNNDVFYMFLQILLDEQNEDHLSNFISSGYTTRDFNMDGTVIFQGPNNDKSILLWNTVYNHPDNEQNQSNFVVTTAEIVTQANYDDCIRDNTQSFCDFDNDGKLNGSDPDDDNDGVADGNDANPYDKNSDSDGDGITDDIETGQDGTYQSGTDTDPLSPCDPHQDNGVCAGIDMDRDSLFSNYPVNHAKYDPNDQNACEPNGTATECSCPDEDGDGFIFVCTENENTGRSTVKIPVKDWLAQRATGTVCGPCQNVVATDCEKGVTLLSKTYRSVKGTSENPKILNFNIPKGNNRTLIIIADFEREHCDNPNKCNPIQHPSGEGLGDNFAFKNMANGIPFINAEVSGAAGSILLKSSIESSLKRNLLKYNSFDRTPEKAYHSRELYMLTLGEGAINALLGNVNAGTVNIKLPGVSLSKSDSDEAILFAYVFENVAQEKKAIDLFKGSIGSENVMGNFKLSLNELGNGTPTNQIEDGLLVIGMNSMENAGFKTLEGFTELTSVSIQNTGGNFVKANEGDGMSTSIQFRNGVLSEQLHLQSTGAATMPCIGGAGLVFAIHSCYD